jgi:hypothetical protein
MASEFKQLLIDIINTGKVDQTKYSGLSEEYKKIIDLLFSSSIMYKLHNQEKLDEMINRFNILKGEILIGNDNKDLLKELKVLVLKLVENNILNFSQINKLLQYIFYII